MIDVARGSGYGRYTFFITLRLPAGFNGTFESPQTCPHQVN